MTLRAPAAAALLASAPLLLAQPYADPEYPQFRNLSALPGSGFGVTPSGVPGLRGAFAYSTPIGYGLAPWQWVFGVGNLSPDNRLRFLDIGGEGADQTEGNGTGYAMVGIPIGNLRLTFSHMVLSGIFDDSQNFHLQIPTGDPSLGVAVGVQDILGGGGGAAHFHPDAGRISRSFFGVVTYRLAEDTYASAGIGDRRFRQGFANFSRGFGRDFKMFVEHDGYVWHYGGAYSPHLPNFRLLGRDGRIVLTVGQARGTNQFWAVNLAF
jgi:hypothetical protein